jgi:putative chitinase
MIDWASVIRRIAPGAKLSIISGLANAMPRVIKLANLNTPLRQAHFLAQLAHESDGFKTTTEYASGAAYNGRTDLGNLQPGDGVRYKGRGLIQITGRDNYRSMGRALGQDFENNPSLAAQFPWAALTAAVYWQDRKINGPADKDDLRRVTRLINGGLNGLSDRARYLKIAKAVLQAAPVSPAPSTPILKAQQRLVELSYPLGSVDGIMGPLTRSAVRDFQDAMDLPVTGTLDDATLKVLMSDQALTRPVSSDRLALTVDDLKHSGSKIVTASEAIKSNVATAGGALAAASGVASQVTTVTDQIQTVKQAVETGHNSLSWVLSDWKLIVIFLLLLVVVFCVYKIWKHATDVEEIRVESARLGENVRI